MNKVNIKVNTCKPVHSPFGAPADSGLDPLFEKYYRRSAQIREIKLRKIKIESIIERICLVK